MSEKDKNNLLNILDCINKINIYKEDINCFEEDWQIVTNHIPILKDYLNKIEK